MNSSSCPKCREKTLISCKAEGFSFSVEQCSKCHGLWFDRGELEAVLGKLAVTGLTHTPDDANVSAAICPACHRFMHSFKYPGTYAKIEMCLHCGGFWLDANELEEIIAVRQYREKHPQQQQQKQAEPEDNSLPDGIKGGIINMINNAIDRLSSF